MYLCPFFEQWVTGDRAYHNVVDRPRNAAARTAFGVAVVTFYAVFLLESASDLIADHLDIPLYTITWTARVAVFADPVVAYIVTKRVCLGLQRKDRNLLQHGLETGIIRQLPSGEFAEVHRPVSEEKRAVLLSNKEPLPLPPGGVVDENGVPAPASRGLTGRLRATANRVLSEQVLVNDGNGDGPDGGQAKQTAAVRPQYQTRGHDLDRSTPGRPPGGTTA